MKYTPGPWTYERRRSDEYLIKGDTGAGYIATVYAAMVGDGPFEANARLISAAPDLLETLKMARKVLVIACGQESPYIKICLKQIDLVVAKVEGREAGDESH